MKIKFLALIILLACSYSAFAQIEEVKEEAITESKKSEKSKKSKKASTKIYKIVEEHPRFYSEECETLSNAARNKCATDAMLKFISDNISYPKKAKKKGITGTVVINFVVDANGEIKEAKILRDIGAGCGKEALRIVSIMPPWTPGKKESKPVAVYFNIPIKFKL